MGQGRSNQETLGSGLLPAFVLLAVSLPLAVAAGLTPPANATQVAVVGAPGASSADLITLVATANGRILRAGGVASIIVAVSDHPDFTARLYRAGAWLVLNPVLPGCSPTRSRKS